MIERVAGETDLIVIGGPTATGKSSLAQEIALRIDGEVISADSMQIYRGMDIGTAKIPVSERRVPHHGLDLIDPGEPYSAALYQAYARTRIAEIRERGRTPILVGGTGFYIRAVVDDYEFAAGCQVNNAVRDAYNALAREEGNEAVWRELQRLDPSSAHIIHPHNVKRVIRALEMHAEGESYAERAKRLHHIPQLFPATFIGLKGERFHLYAMIDRRVDLMREAGLIDEVEGLLSRGFRNGLCAQQAIGYKEIVSALDGEVTMDEAFDMIKRSTRRYAKRQISWFGQDERYAWFDIEDMIDDGAGKVMRACNLIS